MSFMARRRLGLNAAALVVLLLALGSQLPGSTATAANTQSDGHLRVASRRALLQAEAPKTTGPAPVELRRRPRRSPVPVAAAAPLAPPNATDLAVEALNATGAEATLSANESVATIFAPTDAAFEALAAALNLSSPLDLFNATYNATAANITALHVIPGEILTAANITALGNVTATSLLGYNLTIFVEPNGTIAVTVPGSEVVANVVTADVPFNTSIVHIIDKVLLPPANETATWALPLPPTAP